MSNMCGFIPTLGISAIMEKQRFSHIFTFLHKTHENMTENRKITDMAQISQYLLFFMQKFDLLACKRRVKTGVWSTSNWSHKLCSLACMNNPGTLWNSPQVKRNDNPRLCNRMVLIILCSPCIPPY